MEEVNEEVKEETLEQKKERFYKNYQDIISMDT